MVEASLLQTYGFDLAAEWGTIGCRRLWVLIQGLPEDAPVWREEAWSRADEFAAQTLELLDVWNRRMYQVFTGKKAPGPAYRIPRPFTPDKQELKTNQRKITSLSEMGKIAAWFGKHGGG